jgi:NADPH:quinone reductase-like Zn-dependent oxidoreductase
MPSAWQIRHARPSDWRSLEALDNLHLDNKVTKPSPSDLEPNSVLVRVRAASINARDMMVIAHDPFYPYKTKPGLTPCADGAGEIEAVGPGSKWKVGDRVIISPGSWDKKDDIPTLGEFEGKGAGNVQGTLRQYAVLVALPSWS